MRFVASLDVCCASFCVIYGAKMCVVSCADVALCRLCLFALCAYVVSWCMCCICALHGLLYCVVSVCPHVCWVLFWLLISL